MALEASQPLKISLEASADLSASQYYFVKLDSNGRAAVVAANGDVPIGVLQNKPKGLGQMCEVVVIGVTKLVAGGTITAEGGFIGPNSSGQARAATVNTTSAFVQPTNWAVGTAIPLAATQTSIAANDLFEAMVNCVTPIPAT